MGQVRETPIGGRPARVHSVGRVRSKVGRSFYNLMSVRLLDNNEAHTMGAAEFAKWSTKLEREHAAKPHCEEMRGDDIEEGFDAGEWTGTP